MIKVFLQGGLGNQMFQYAAGFSLAKENSAPLFLDTTFLNDRFPRKQFTYRNYDLDIFSVAPRFSSLSLVSEKVPVPGIWLGVDLVSIKFNNLAGIRRVVRETERSDIKEWAHETGSNGTLLGYFQSEKYFLASKEDIRKEFTFKIPMSPEAAGTAASIQACNSVSLHVRRGDYVNFKNNVSLFGGTDISYYERAIDEIARNVEAPHFFVFSNDIEWCRQNLPVRFPVTYVDSSVAGPKDSFHLQLMSLCRHNIIANSSFSWWGAWLNMNPKKIVIAPRKWYANQEKDSGDILPADWIKM